MRQIVGVALGLGHGGSRSLFDALLLVTLSRRFQTRSQADAAATAWVTESTGLSSGQRPCWVCALGPERSPRSARLACLLVLAWLGGCVAQPSYNRAPVPVGAGELHRYWVPAQAESDVRVPAEAQKNKVPGRVVIAYVIDSEGKVINPRVVSAEPPGLYDKSALSLIRTQRFRPAAGNPDRIPVSARTEITFNMDEGG